MGSYQQEEEEEEEEMNLLHFLLHKLQAGNIGIY